MSRSVEIPLRLSITAGLLLVMVVTLGACGKKSDSNEGRASGSAEVARMDAPGEAVSAAPGVSDMPPRAEEPAREAQSAETGKSPRTEPQVPDFSLQDLDGNTVRISDFRGKVVLIDFWATWCPPCRKEVPHLIELHSHYASQGFTVLGISLDEKGPSAVRSFVSSNRVTYPIVMGDQATAQKFGNIRAIPTAFLVDRDGYVVGKYEGYREKSFFEAEIEKALGGAS